MLEDIQIENFNFFLKSSKKIDKHRKFISDTDTDSLIVGLADQEIDEPDYTSISLSVKELIQHNGLILIGALSGYFPKNLTDDTINQILRFLEIGPISDYYSLRNKLPIGSGVQAYLIAVKNNATDIFYNSSNYTIQEEREIFDIFNEFLVLYYSFKKDKAIELFLKIFDFYESLESQTVLGRIEKAIISDSELYDAIDNSEPNPITGALNFLQFSSELSDLCKKTEGNSVLQSSLWYFYSNYYGNRSVELGSFYDKLFVTLTTRLNNSVEKDGFLKELNHYYEDDIVITTNDLKTIIDKTRENIFFLCNKNLGKALKTVSDSIFEDYGVFEYA